MIPTITKECSEFLNLSNGNYLIKYLKSEGEGLRKVKVRTKKSKVWSHEFVHTFNNAFPEYNKLLQRSIIASNKPENPNIGEEFFIFPINGFKYVYNPTVTNIDKTYRDIFEKLKLIFPENSNDFLNEILKNGYTSNNLEDGIKENSQILIYDVPYYYALRKSLVVDYKKLIYDDSFSIS